jgi:hypothetical protein
MDQAEFEKSLQKFGSSKTRALVDQLTRTTEKLTRTLREYLKAEEQLALYSTYEVQFDNYGASLDSEAQKAKASADSKVKSTGQEFSQVLSSAKRLVDRLVKKKQFLNQLF